MPQVSPKSWNYSVVYSTWTPLRSALVVQNELLEKIGIEICWQTVITESLRKRMRGDQANGFKAATRNTKEKVRGVGERTGKRTILAGAISVSLKLSLSANEQYRREEDYGTLAKAHNWQNCSYAESLTIGSQSILLRSNQDDWSSSQERRERGYLRLLIRNNERY